MDYDKLEKELTDLHSQINKCRKKNINNDDIYDIIAFTHSHIPENIKRSLIDCDTAVFSSMKSNKRRVEMYTNIYDYDNILMKLNKRLDEFADDEMLKNIFKIILDYMIECNIIYILWENNYSKIEIDTDGPDNDIKELEERENQKEAYDRLKIEGLVTGIHCQATGCGKTNIILHYIDYMNKHYKNAKIILFTERVNILKDLFDIKDNHEINKTKIQKWKTLGIADLTQFNIINRVTIKKKDWMKELIASNKPTLLVINRAYLTLDKKQYETMKNINGVLHDECHNTSSDKCHEFLLRCKSYNIPIIGFSATPLRTGKDDKSKLLQIYGDANKNLKLLTNYNMIYAISKNLILPPEFYWYHIDVNTKKKLNKENDMMSYELGTVMEILHTILPKLPNKKIVAWCGRIDHATKWRKMFHKHHLMKASLHGFKFYLDTSKTSDEEYNKFKKSDGKCILFCANKHREGSDISKLDACMFLDGVVNRGCIPFIQSIGRVLRRDINNINKTRGIVIDGIYKYDDYEKDFVDKIIGYYMSLQNLAEVVDESGGKSKYEQYEEIRNIIQFDKENEMIHLNFNSSIININVNKLHWDDIIVKFDNIMTKKIKMSTDDNMMCKGKILVDKFNFNERTDFYNEYIKISNDDKIKYNLPDVDTEEYNILFIGKSWFEFLRIENNFYKTPASALRGLKKIVEVTEPRKNWEEWCKLDDRLPPYPQYVWDNFNMDMFGGKKKILFA